MDAARRATGTKYECLLFDMDDTLNPLSSGLNLAYRTRYVYKIEFVLSFADYMLRHLNIEQSDVPRMCLELYREYGTTMAGLKALGYEFDNDEFHAFVRGRLPYDTLKADPVLRSLLLSMPQRKIIFTNADKAHALEVLNRLGLEDCFEGIICFETLNPALEQADSMDALDDNAVLAGVEGELDITDSSDANSVSSKQKRVLCKPALEAIEAAIQIANVDPKKTLFFDDSARNIASGKAAGLQTIIVGSSVLIPGADYALSSIHNIKEAIPEIWEDEEGEQPGFQ